MPIFNKDEFMEKWEEENPPVAIPNEVIDDIDNDWKLTEEEEESLV